MGGAYEQNKKAKTVDLIFPLTTFNYDLAISQNQQSASSGVWVKEKLLKHWVSRVKPNVNSVKPNVNSSIEQLVKESRSETLVSETFRENSSFTCFVVKSLLFNLIRIS